MAETLQNGSDFQAHLKAMNGLPLLPSAQRLAGTPAGRKDCGQGEATQETGFRNKLASTT